MVPNAPIGPAAGKSAASVTLFNEMNPNSGTAAAEPERSTAKKIFLPH
jgi:hypothetical protein